MTRLHGCLRLHHTSGIFHSEGGGGLTRMCVERDRVMLCPCMHWRVFICIHYYLLHENIAAESFASVLAVCSSQAGSGTHTHCMEVTIFLKRGKCVATLFNIHLRW